MAEDVVEGLAVSGALLAWPVVQALADRLDVMQALAARCGLRADSRTVEIRELLEGLIARAGARVDASTRVQLEDLPQAEAGLVDTATAAERLGLTEDTVRWHCRQGRFAKVAIRRGGRWWIPVADVEAHARGNND